MKNSKLIEELVHDLKPVKKLQPLSVRISIWFIAILAIVVFELIAIAEARPDALAMLKTNYMFLAETILILLAPITAAIGALLLSVPGNEKMRWLQYVSLGLFLCFVLLNFYNLWFPIFPNDIYSHQRHCELNISIIGLMPMLILYFLVKKAAPLNWKWLSGLVTMGAFLPIVALLQITCMGSALHVLVTHILPVVALFFIINAFGKKYL